jgi:hypothetical protein
MDIRRFSRGKTFMQKINFNEVRVHAGDKPYICDIGQKYMQARVTFTMHLPSGTYDHIRVHAGYKV